MCAPGLPLLYFQSVQFLKPVISQGSVATPLKFVGSVMVFRCKLAAELAVKEL